MVVMKFGGKSLSTPNKVEDIVKYIKRRSQNEKIIVVVSAMGNTTNKLLLQAKQFGIADPRELDALLATGEMQSASLFCLSLKNYGLKAKSLNAAQVPIRANGNHLNSEIDIVETANILKLCENNIIPVVTGFQGINEQGDFVTLGRGGSDTSAVALGAALGCKVELYSDFQGIFTGDPRRGAYKKLKHIDYDSLLLYAQSGAKVVSESAAKLAKSKQVKLECKGSTTPEQQGTLVNSSHYPFKAINVNDNEISLIYNNCTLSKTRIEKMLKKYDIYYMNQSIHSFKFLTNQQTTTEIEACIAEHYHLLQ